MIEYNSKVDFLESIKNCLEITPTNDVILKNEKIFREKIIDELVWNIVFSPSEEVKNIGKYILRYLAYKFGMGPYSIQEIYEARGRGEFADLTVPAINLRGMTYDSARAVFRAAKERNVGLLILEIARSEISYTAQPPSEYSAVIIAAALKEDFKKPLFIQGDHFQVSGSKYKKEPEKEINAVKDLIKKAISAGFYNIDIDTSTLVDLSKQDINEQQKENYTVCCDILKFIRENQPQGITIATGGEIGEIGGKNSTEEELRAFLNGLANLYDGKKVVKIAVQTGTVHGGIPLPDGKIAKVKLDFDTLEKLGKIGRQEYKIAGCVQHGASTLPLDLFDKFPKTQTAEIHLATEFQNMIFDSPLFPKELNDEIKNWIFQNLQDERKEGDTDQQFIYKTRKKAFGPFKREIWSLPKEIREEISNNLKEKFSTMFEKLNVINSDWIVNKYLNRTSVKPEFETTVKPEQVDKVAKSLSD